MNHARAILENTGFQIVGKAVTALLSIVVIKLITWYLSDVSGFGEYTTIYAYLAFFGIIADMGIYTIAVREMAKTKEKIEHIIGNVLSVRTILIFLSMISAVIAVCFIPRYAGTRIPIGVVLASIVTMLTLINGTICSVLQVYLKMQYATFSLVIGKTTSVLYMFFIVFILYPKENPLSQTLGFYHLIIAGIIGNIIMLIITFYFTKKFTRIYYKFDIKFWWRVFKTSFPYGLALILNTIYLRLDILLLSLIRNDGSQQVGIYGVPMRILEVLGFLPVYFMNSVLPVMSKKIKEKSNEVKTIIEYSFSFLSGAGVPIVVGSIILAYPIVKVISQKEYLSRLNEGFFGSDIAFKILIFALLFSFINSLFGFTLVALGKQMKLLWINFICVVFNLGTNLIVIPRFGFRGAAATSVLSELLILVLTFYAAYRIIKFRISIKRELKIFFSAIIMGCVVYGLRDFTFRFMENKNLIVLIPIGALIYIGMLFVTKAVSKKMLAVIRK